MKSAFVFALSAVIVPLALFGQETRRQYLSGKGKDDAVPWKFFCTAGAQSGYWTNLPVPSNWELHGFGTLNYGKDSTNAFTEQGRYERDFTVPPEWLGQRVFLVFDGVMTDAHVELNGQPVGLDHQGGFYRFRHEITKLLKPSNRLNVVVSKYSANESVNRAERQSDYWLFGGIYRPVYLEAVPPQFIERVAIDARADGAFAVDVFIDGAGEGDRVEAQVFELGGRPVGEVATDVVPAGPAREGPKPDATLRTRITSPRQWTAETPDLYRVEARLKRGDRVLHRFTQRFGFRTMEVRDGDGIYVNGRRVILKGANRHSFWPDSGRCLSEAVHRLDIDLMKEMNMNAVRMSHYPPDEQFLDLCDELGLYVLDELGGWQKSYDTPTARRLVEQTVIRDVNHPSILFWDNGNEGGWNSEVDGDYAKWDPQQRRVLHPWSTFNGVNAAHYLTYDRTKPAAQGMPSFRGSEGRDAEARTNNAKFVHLPTEFVHGLFDGGAGAGLEDHWELMRSGPYFGGGFIWALLDEGVKRADNGQIDVFGNRAPDGILGPYREKEGSFYAIKELWSPIVVKRIGDRGLAIENRYSFTDANQCKFFWELLKFPQPADAARSPALLGSGTIRVQSIPPGRDGQAEIELPGQWSEADGLRVGVLDRAGRMVWGQTWPMPGMERFRKLLDAESATTAVANETDEQVEVKAGDLTVLISKRDGMLAGVRRGTQNYSLKNGPLPVPTEAFAKPLVKSQASGRDQVVTVKSEGASSSIHWRVCGNGWVTCDYDYSAKGAQEYHGVTFDYPEQFVKHKRWLGDGPYRVWKNRRQGGTLGVWRNDYNDTITGWSGWAYPEFKGCFANVRWLQLETAEGLITVVPQPANAFVQVLTPDLPPTNLLAKTVVSLPPAGLAFLTGIPPIGNKFHAPRDTGPQGRSDEATGYYRGSVSFYFGRLP